MLLVTLCMPDPSIFDLLIREISDANLPANDFDDLVAGDIISFIQKTNEDVLRCFTERLCERIKRTEGTERRHAIKRLATILSQDARARSVATDDSGLRDVLQGEQGRNLFATAILRTWNTMLVRR